jgi:general secretion pathway protein L
VNALVTIGTAWSDWIDSVAVNSADLVDRFARPRTVRLLQRNGNEFIPYFDQATSSAAPPERITIDPDEPTSHCPAGLAAALSGSRVELILSPDLFLFCPLELPARAAEFMHGIVRAQIDRLTPWTAAAAAFGWSKPTPVNSDRVSVMVAATDHLRLKPYIDAITRLGCHSVAILTTSPQADGDATPIKVQEIKVRGVCELSRIRKALVLMLGGCAIAMAVTLSGAAVIDASLQSQESDLAQKLARLRANAGNAQQALERRKHETPSAVMVLEVLSEVLPDHTYVTEFRIEANKVRLIGVTRDAASLVELIERSGRFRGASFFAPTTRSSSNAGERFHIEATIQPNAALRS